MDTHSPSVRSYNMSRIRSKNTKPELLVRKFLFNQGFRFRLHSKNLPGSPDIILKKYKTVIFINGCFWHGHEGNPCFKPSKSNLEYWSKKIENNKNRDNKNYQTIKNLGWKVIIIWECELKKSKIDNTFINLIDTLYFNK